MAKRDGANDPKIKARRMLALQLRMQGEDYLDIGRILGVAKSTAHKDVKAAEHDETIKDILEIHKINCLETAINSVKQLSRFAKQVTKKGMLSHDDVRELEKISKTTMKVYQDMQGSVTDDLGGSVLVDNVVYEKKD